jgi:hypothetical protein
MAIYTTHSINEVLSFNLRQTIIVWPPFFNLLFYARRQKNSAQMKRTNTCFALSEFLCNLPIATVSDLVDVDPDIYSVLTRRDAPFTGFTQHGFLYYKPQVSHILTENRIEWHEHRPVFLSWKTTRPWDLNNTHHVKSAFTYLAKVVIPQVKG